MPRPIRDKFTIPNGAAFGAQRAGGARRHNGTDYHCPVGTPIYGTGEGGRVTHVGANMDRLLGLGHNVTISYPDGTTLDAHMLARTPLRVGSEVGPNTLVGYVGLTGNAVNASPPGSHLHHERRKTNGLLVNPEAQYGVSSAAGGGHDPIEDDMQADEREALLQIRDVLGAKGGLNTDTGQTVAYLVRDLSAALTTALPAMATREQKILRYLSDGGEDVTGTIGDPGSVFGRVIGLQAQLAGLSEAVKALAVGQGVDPAAIEDAARRGAEKALENVHMAVLKD